MDNEKILKQFKLLAEILRQPSDTEYEEILAKVKIVIYEKLPNAFNQGAPLDYPELITDLQGLYEQFRNFVMYDKLIGKNVVALGGGFSCGKSSFLNAINGESALPTDIDPSTAVPTFIVNGEKHKAVGVNIFDAKIPIELQDFRSISHGFGELRDEDGELILEPVLLGHVLKSVFLMSPKQAYQKLAFVDTPGFSKPDSDSYSAKTDETISRSQLDSSSYNLLFVQADAGTLKDEDIQFIQSLRKDIPKLFIVSKADVKSEQELENIVAHIRSQLLKNGIAHIDVLSFSSRKPTEYDSKAIHEILNQWNENQEAPKFARNFKKLFIRCRAYFEEAIEVERRRLEKLNQSMTRMEGEDAEVLDSLRWLVKEGQDRVQELKKSYETLKNLKDEFFGELKRVCDRIGIDMPEPSEIEMVEDVPDPFEILRNYKNAKKIKTNQNTKVLIQDAFVGIKCVLDTANGGSSHRERMISLIQTNCQVDPKQIRINDEVNRADTYLHHTHIR